MTVDQLFSACLFIVASIFYWLIGDVGARGKFRDPNKHSNGLINQKVGWVIMEAPAVIVFSATFFIHAPETLNLYIFALVAVWLMHYLYRAFVYPFTLNCHGDSKDSLVDVLIGSTWCGINGFMNAFWICNYSSFETSNEILLFWLGMLVFTLGFITNKYSDRVLNNLRPPGDSNYYIPHGGLFNFVSSPHYLGEIIQWIGFAVAAQSLPGYLFVMLTVSNLAPRAFLSHQWYLKNLEDYPKHRKALIPFVL